MASLSISKNTGRARILFTNKHGERKALYAGRVTKQQARRLATLVEDLNSARCTGSTPRPRILDEANDLAAGLKKKLVHLDLLDPPPEEKLLTVPQLIDCYLESHTHLAESTLRLKRQVARNLVQCYGNDLADEVEGQQFLTYLHNETDVAGTTINQNLKDASSIWNWAAARKRGFVGGNPFKGLRADEDPVGQVYVEDEVIGRILEHCPLNWRTIIALARYAGLRCPSEALGLRWENVEWEQNRIFIKGVKTESRWIPIFARLRPFLEEAYQHRCGASVVECGKGANLRTALTRFIKKAGESPWPKLFNSLRGSCETQLIDDGWPEHKVQKWMGHSEKISRKHYLKLSENDFRLASQVTRKTTQKSVETIGNMQQVVCADNGQGADFDGFSANCGCLEVVQDETRASVIEPNIGVNPEENGHFSENDAPDDAPTSALAQILAKVGALSEDETQALLAMSDSQLELVRRML